MISPNLIKPRLPEVGYIKIGGLEEKVRKTDNGVEWQAPTNFDHFVVTTNQRDEHNNLVKDDSVHEVVGKEPTELEVMLLYPKWEDNFFTTLAHYVGKKCVCRGNGQDPAEEINHETGEVKKVPCPCQKLTEKKCKPHGVLTCLLGAASVTGGVYRFSTTSWNTINNIQSSLFFINTKTRGRVNGIPLWMKFSKKDATIKVKGEERKTKISVVSLLYKGNPRQLMLELVKNERDMVRAGLSLETMEEQERRKMAFENQGPLRPEEIPEFAPEEEIEDTEPVNQGKPPDPPKPSIDDVFGKNNPPKADPEKPAMNYFVCLGCGGWYDRTGTLAKCGGCNSTKIEKCPSEEAAKKRSGEILERLQGKTETKIPPAETKPPQAEITAPKTETTPPAGRDAILQRIADLRGKFRVMQGIFISIVAGAIKKPVSDANKWSDDEAGLILAAMEAKYGGAK